jgi:hypothetical protein
LLAAGEFGGRGGTADAQNGVAVAQRFGLLDEAEAAGMIPATRA